MKLLLTYYIYIIRVKVFGCAIWPPVHTGREEGTRIGKYISKRVVVAVIVAVCRGRASARAPAPVRESARVENLCAPHLPVTTRKTRERSHLPPGRVCVSIFKEYYMPRAGHTRGPASCYRPRHLSLQQPPLAPICHSPVSAERECARTIFN